jgi:hypothetical protein
MAMLGRDQEDQTVRSLRDEPSLTEGASARRIKVDLGTDMDWSFRKALGVR